MSKENAIRVLIADDHPVVRQGLAAMIEYERDMTIVAEVEDGEEAVASFARHHPDVALLDLRMPRLDGLAAIIAIRDQYPNARIIVLTTYDHEEDIYRALRAGARAYLLKDSPAEDLLAAIRTVHAGQKHIPAGIGAKLSEHMSRPPLTERELEVLRLIVAGQSNQAIAKSLVIAEGTVKYHVNNILTKLGVNDRTQAVTSALKSGMVHL